MVKVLLDTNFIISCVKKKIDFLSQLEEDFPGCNIIIPLQVIQELEKLLKKSKLKGREAVKLSLDILAKKQKSGFETIDLRTDRVDKGIINFISENKTNKIMLATLDKELRQKLKMKLKGKTRFLAIRGKRIIWI